LSESLRIDAAQKEFAVFNDTWSEKNSPSELMHPFPPDLAQAISQSAALRSVNERN